MVATRRKILWTGVAVATLALGSAGAVRLLRPRRAWIVVPAEEVARARNPHDHQGRLVCAACHLDRDRRLRSEPLVLCRGCHSFQHGNHPVNVRPRKDAKDPGLPLWSGRVVCHTCHDPHDVRARRHGLRLAFNDLCARCHEPHL